MIGVVSSRQISSAASATTTATLAGLCDHLERTRHPRLREALPRLEQLADALARGHCSDAPRRSSSGGQTLRNLRDIVDALGDEMEAHMRRAESAFFPLCRRLDRAGAAGAPDTGTAPCRGLVEAAVRLMAAEDDDAREALDALRALTNDFAPPADACDSYRALLRGFRELDADLRRHLDEEKRFLFPRALAADAAAAAQAAHP